MIIKPPKPGLGFGIRDSGILDLVWLWLGCGKNALAQGFSFGHVCCVCVSEKQKYVLTMASYAGARKPHGPIISRELVTLLLVCGQHLRCSAMWMMMRPPGMWIALQLSSAID